MIEKTEFIKNVTYRPHPDVFVFMYKDPDHPDTVAAWIKVCRMLEISCPKCWAVPETSKASNVVKIHKPGDNGKNALEYCESCKSFSDSKKWKKVRMDIIDIRTEPAYRGQGYAKMLIQLIQDKCDRLITYWDESTKEGRGVCGSCGMEHRGEIMEWRKA